jgi:hypothetical protein
LHPFSNQKRLDSSSPDLIQLWQGEEYCDEVNSYQIIALPIAALSAVVWFGN